MNVEIGAEAALVPEKEYMSGIFVAVQCVGTPLLTSPILYVWEMSGFEPTELTYQVGTKPT